MTQKGDGRAAHPSMRRAGLAILGVVGGIVIGVATLSQTGLRSPTAQADVAVPAAALTGESYVLSDFEIIYPFREVGNLDPDPAWAGVSFTEAWTGDGFPGRADCSLILRDASGAVVGSFEGRPLFEPKWARVGPVRVRVSGTPASVEGGCVPASGVYAPGRGYDFEWIEKKGTGTDTTLYFTSHWATTIDPTLRNCELTVDLVDGQTHTQEFGFMAPDGANFDQLVLYAHDDIIKAAVVCRAL